MARAAGSGWAPLGTRHYDSGAGPFPDAPAGYALVVAFRIDARSPGRRAADELRLRADAITSRLLYSDEPRVDLDIAINDLRDFVETSLPDRMWLFDCIYEAPEWTPARSMCDMMPGISTDSPSQMASTSTSLPSRYLSISTG